MKAAIFRGAFDIQVEQIPDAAILEPTDAVVHITHACICGTDLWPYRTLLVNETRMTEIVEVGKDGKIGTLGGKVRPREAEPGEDGGRPCRCILRKSELFPLKQYG